MAASDWRVLKKSLAKKKKMGSPLPGLNIASASSSTQCELESLIQTVIYLKNHLVCGCEMKHSFICFLCVLWVLNHLSKNSSTINFVSKTLNTVFV